MIYLLINNILNTFDNLIRNNNLLETIKKWLWFNMQSKLDSDLLDASYKWHFLH